METDIYCDLDKDSDLGSLLQKLTARNKQLEGHIISLENDISKLCTKLKEMKNVQDNLTKNISELYKTAKNEIDRKDRLITDLQAKLDDFIFKRNTNIGSKKSREQIVKTEPSETREIEREHKWTREHEPEPKRIKEHIIFENNTKRKREKIVFENEPKMNKHDYQRNRSHDRRNSRDRNYNKDRLPQGFREKDAFSRERFDRRTDRNLRSNVANKSRTPNTLPENIVDDSKNPVDLEEGELEITLPCNADEPKKNEKKPSRSTHTYRDSRSQKFKLASTRKDSPLDVKIDDLLIRKKKIIEEIKLETNIEIGKNPPDFDVKKYISDQTKMRANLSKKPKAESKGDVADISKEKPRIKEKKIAKCSKFNSRPQSPLRTDKIDKLPPNIHSSEIDKVKRKVEEEIDACKSAPIKLASETKIMPADSTRNEHKITILENIQLKIPLLTNEVKVTAKPKLSEEVSSAEKLKAVDCIDINNKASIDEERERRIKSIFDSPLKNISSDEHSPYPKGNFNVLSLVESFGLTHDGEILELGKSVGRKTNLLDSVKTDTGESSMSNSIIIDSEINPTPVSEFQIFKANITRLGKSNTGSSVECIEKSSRGYETKSETLIKDAQKPLADENDAEKSSNETANQEKRCSDEVKERTPLTQLDGDENMHNLQDLNQTESLSIIKAADNDIDKANSSLETSKTQSGRRKRKRCTISFA